MLGGKRRRSAFVYEQHKKGSWSCDERIAKWGTTSCRLQLASQDLSKPSIINSYSFVLFPSSNFIPHIFSLRRQQQKQQQRKVFHSFISRKRVQHSSKPVFVQHFLHSRISKHIIVKEERKKVFNCGCVGLYADGSAVSKKAILKLTNTREV